MPQRGDLELIAFGSHVHQLHLAEMIVIIQESDDTGTGGIPLLQRRPGLGSEIGEVDGVRAGKPFKINVDTIVHCFGSLIQSYHEFSMLRFLMIFRHRLFFHMRPQVGVVFRRRKDRMRGIHKKSIPAGGPLAAGARVTE